MSLPDAWVERIFTKLTMVYGHQFLSRWDGLQLADVKADWGHELSAYQQSPQAIGFALENLPPTKPPTVLEFRGICQRAPARSAAPQLGHSPATVDPEKVRSVIGGIRSSPIASDPKAWAHRLKERHDAGEKLNMNQVRCYKNALGLHPNGAQL